MRYYIADPHFWHANLLERMDCRGFSTVEEMNDTMAERWNRRVGARDEVYILGDFSMGTVEQTEELLRKLRGKKYLITGNHDHRYLNKPEFHRELYEWIQPYFELCENGRRIVMMHYPVFCYNGQYRRNGKGVPTVWMLHGHVHNTVDQKLLDSFAEQTRRTSVVPAHADEPVFIPCQMINCFCMFSDYVPLTLDEWIEKDAQRRSR